MNPSPGTNNTFGKWLEVVAEEIRKHLPDVHAARSSASATFSNGRLVVRIKSGEPVWWVHFERAGEFAMPPLSIEIHDDRTARSVAKTMLGFFDANLSR